MEEEVPVDYSDFDHKAQLVFKIFKLLPDKVDPMSGSYLGKDFSIVEYLFKVHEVDFDQQRDYLDYLIHLSDLVARHVNDKKPKQPKGK